MRPALLTLAGSALFLSAACDKLPLLAPTQSTITLFASSTIVQANGTTDIIATVLEQAGTPVQNGTVVTFTTTLGSIDPQEARTNNGKATVRFVAGGQSGDATIGAVSGGAAVAAADRLTIKVGAAAAARIQMNANPTRVPASGGSSVITATVSDTNGNPLVGIPVTFSADVGTLSSSSATTSSGGEARVTLTTNRESKVTASAGTATSGTAAVSGTVTVTVNSLPALSFGTVTPASPVADQAVVFPLTITSTATSSLFQSVVVNFGDGTSRNLGAQNTSTSLSHTYGSDGSFTVTATGSDSTGDSVSASVIVIVAERPPIGITISTTTPSTTVGTAVTFAGTVTAPTNGSVIRSVTVDYGDGSSPVSVGTSTTYSVTHVFSLQGNYTVRATATDNFNGTSTASTQVVITARVPLSVTVEVTSTVLKPNLVIAFKATASPNSAIDRYEWDFGDGTTLTTTGNTASHVYTNTVSTPYTVLVRVVAVDGNSGRGQMIVIIAP